MEGEERRTDQKLRPSRGRVELKHDFLCLQHQGKPVLQTTCSTLQNVHRIYYIYTYKTLLLQSLSSSSSLK